MLYQYRGVRPDRDEQLLRRSEVFFCSPATFNDPFEAKPHIVADPRVLPTKKQMMRSSQWMHGGSRNERRRAASEQLKRYATPEDRAARAEELRVGLAALFQRTSICCFTSDSDDIRMWSYYADKHMGYCVGFSFTDADPWIWTNASQGRMQTLQPYKVDYSDSYPIVDADADFEVIEVAAKLIRASVLTKAKEWMHEKEWRLVLPGTAPAPFAFPPRALKQLIFGHSIDSAYRDQLFNLAMARSSPPQILQARTASDRYQLTLVPYEP